MAPQGWIFKEQYEFRVLDSFADEPQFIELRDQLLGNRPLLEKLLSHEELRRHMAMSGVHPDHQRRGIYSELIRAVLAFSKEQNVVASLVLAVIVFAYTLYRL